MALAEVGHLDDLFSLADAQRLRVVFIALQRRSLGDIEVVFPKCQTVGPIQPFDQDFTLFILLQEQSNAIWRKKLDWIAEKGGMVLIKTHPDYMVFPNESKRIDGYPVGFYRDLLDYITERYGDDAWFAQPSEVASYWRGLRLGNSDNSISWSETFCASCRQAHAEGWLRQGLRVGNLLREALPAVPTSVSSAFDDTHPK